MPAAKKAKLEKVIKSIDKKKDILTLECEWAACDFVCNDTDSFLVHISHHIDEMMMGEAVIKSAEDSVLECCWRECGNEQRFHTFMQLQRHVYFHAFHTRLKSIGASLSTKNALPICQFESSHRNNLPELPDQLKCSWHGCDSVFDIPDVYYSHVSQHADLYPSGNKPDGGCTCLWEGCSMVVRSKHRLKEHLRTHTQQKTMACMTCGSLFANATKMFDHIQRQSFSNTHRYECSHCNRSCATERLLRDHMRQHVNHYRCPYCEKTCPNPSSLKIHVHYRHTEDRPYMCPCCDHWAKTAVDLRRHIDTHNQTKIACEVADCTFHARYYWEMNLHCQIAHDENELSKYVCHLCNRKYRKGNLLTKHLRLTHHYALPSGHKRFRYKKDNDGYYRLLTVRYESMDMKEQVVPGLTPRCVSELQSTDAVMHTGSSVVDLQGSMTDDTVVPMSNLELLGDVAFAMSRSDGVDDCAGQPVVLSTDAASLAVGENDGQVPAGHVMYVISGSGDDVHHSFTAVLQQPVESSCGEHGAGVTDNEYIPIVSDINNTALYFTTLPDNYDTLCNVESMQFGERDTSEHNTGCTEDELAACEPTANIVSTADSGLYHTSDMSLDSFSLSMLTNAVTS